SFFMAEHGIIQMTLPILTVVFVILASMIYQQTEK
ncbi:TerC family protein, partial [Bacillus sp. EKM417B]